MIFMQSKSFHVFILASLIILAGYLPLLSQTTVDTGTAQNKIESGKDIQQFMQDGMKDIDFYSLEELLNVEIEVASLFAEDELVVGSTVSSISPQQWKMRGARRLTDAIENETSLVN